MKRDGKFPREIHQLPGTMDSKRYYTLHVLLAFFVLTQYRRVTDRRTDGHVAVAKTRVSVARVTSRTGPFYYSSTLTSTPVLVNTGGTLIQAAIDE